MHKFIKNLQWLKNRRKIKAIDIARLLAARLGVNMNEARRRSITRMINGKFQNHLVLSQIEHLADIFDVCPRDLAFTPTHDFVKKYDINPYRKLSLLNMFQLMQDDKELVVHADGAIEYVEKVEQLKYLLFWGEKDQQTKKYYLITIKATYCTPAFHFYIPADYNKFIFDVEYAYSAADGSGKKPHYLESEVHVFGLHNIDTHETLIHYEKEYK